MQQEILEVLEEISKNQFLPIIGPIKGQVLAELIVEKRPKKILEVGTLVGYSAMLMALHTNAKITTIEKSKKFAEIAKRNIAKSGLTNRVKVVHGDAREVIPRLKKGFDFIFIDAEKSEYLSYLQLAENKMSKNCVIVADNVKIFKNTLSDYLAYVRSKYKSKLHDFGFDAIEVSVKK